MDWSCRYCPFWRHSGPECIQDEQTCWTSQNCLIPWCLGRHRSHLPIYYYPISPHSAMASLLWEKLASLLQTMHPPASLSMSTMWSQASGILFHSLSPRNTSSPADHLTVLPEKLNCYMNALIKSIALAHITGHYCLTPFYLQTKGFGMITSWCVQQSALH